MEENQLKQLEECKSYVLTTSKWLKFFGIIMIISIVCMFFGGITFLTGGSFLTKAINQGFTEFPTIMGVFYLIMAGIMVIPTIYIMRASDSGKAAVFGNDNVQMVEFLKNNKLYWKFMGIYTIVIVVMAILIFIIAMIAAIATFA
ncbi:MAG: hypothetical protein MJZ97_08195 [Bacteroidales bacterium]|nr:hypothetical protein [Bacteroidales bacterium]